MGERGNGGAISGIILFAVHPAAPLLFQPARQSPNQKSAFSLGIARFLAL